MSAIGFDHPWVLWGFTIFIPLILFRYLSSSVKLIQKNLPKNLMSQLTASQIFFRLFLAFIIIALAGPHWGTGEDAAKEYRRAVDVIIALDVSRSMEVRDGLGINSEIDYIDDKANGTANGMANGTAAGTDADTSDSNAATALSRMERGLSIIKETVEATPGIRFGVAISRSRGIVAVPLTWDSGAMLAFLDAAESSLTGRGTNLESLVDAAAGAFQPSYPSRRVIILVSDGEELSGTLKTAIERCKRDGITVVSVALGSDEGGIVPGESIISRRDPNSMRMAAGQTGGIYIDGSRENASRILASHLRSLAPGSETRGDQTGSTARWFIFALLAIMSFGASKLSLLRLTSKE
jgi:Ca-activated chloride channel family protein